MILCRIIEQVNADVSNARMKTLFFSIISPAPFLITAAVGKPGFQGISNILILPCFQRETIFVTSCLITSGMKSFPKGIGKNLLLSLRVDSNSNGRQTY